MSEILAEAKQSHILMDNVPMSHRFLSPGCWYKCRPWLANQSCPRLEVLVKSEMSRQCPTVQLWRTASQHHSITGIAREPCTVSYGAEKGVYAGTGSRNNVIVSATRSLLGSNPSTHPSYQTVGVNHRSRPGGNRVRVQNGANVSARSGRL
jgi:hypothetical protein